MNVAKEPLQKEKRLQRPFPVPVHLGPLIGQARSGQFLTSFCSCHHFPEVLMPGCNRACMHQTPVSASQRDHGTNLTRGDIAEDVLSPRCCYPESLDVSISPLVNTHGRVVDAQMHRADVAWTGSQPSGCPCHTHAICPWPILKWQTDGAAAELPRAPHQQ